MKIDEIDDTGGATKFADTQIYVLPEGGFFAFTEVDRGRIDVREIASESFKNNDMNPTTFQILGGTGSYAGANGTAVMSFADGVGTFEINVSFK